MKIGVVIADDHEVVRRGLLALLPDEFPDMEIATAGSAGELRDLMTKRHWHLILLDLSMPGTSGLETIELIKESSPRTKILVFSMYPEEQLGVRAIRAGADGYVNKDAPAEQLNEAIRRVLSGNRYLSPALTDKLAELFDESALPEPPIMIRRHRLHA